jgi:X-Pro dipeptidyl-peptidase (S15 family)
LVVADARGTGASFGSRPIELGPREIADYGELIDWVAAQPWSNGRVGVYGTSYEGQAAELVAGLGNPHVAAVVERGPPLATPGEAGPPAPRGAKRHYGHRQDQSRPPRPGRPPSRVANGDFTHLRGGNVVRRQKGAGSLVDGYACRTKSFLVPATQRLLRRGSPGDDGGMGTPTSGSGGGQDLSFSGVVLMKGHPRHPVLHHHGLGDLSVSERVKLLRYHSDEELAASPAAEVTLGTSSTLKEFGSILFVDFGDASVPRHETQWAIDFGLVNDVHRVLHPDGSVNHERLAEYQVLLSVEDIQAGIRFRQQFIDAVTALGGRYEDESTSFERLTAKWPY